MQWTEMLDEATKIVRNEFLFKKFIQGTPLENDIPVWMASFAKSLQMRSANKDLYDELEGMRIAAETPTTPAAE